MEAKLVESLKRPKRGHPNSCNFLSLPGAKRMVHQYEYIDGPYPNRFSMLPIELLRYIMELAARESKRTALSLVRVCKLFKKWITPILYHTVKVNTVGVIYLFRSLEAPSTRHLGGFIRRLWIGSYHSIEVAVVLRACTGLEFFITDTGLYHDFFAEDPLDPSSWPTPWHIMLVKVGLQLPSPSHPLLQRTTHLFLGYVDNDIPESLPMLPSLTHLGLACWRHEDQIDPSHIETLLTSIPSLEILLLFADETDVDGQFVGDLWTEIAKIEDERLFVRSDILFQEEVMLWDSGLTLWDDATTEYKDWRRRCGERRITDS